MATFETTSPTWPLTPGRLCRASQQSCEGRCALHQVDALAKIFKTAGCWTSRTKVAEQG
jgi:hypothetical protein